MKIFDYIEFFGITGKIVGGQINYVLGMYCFNLTVVSFDLMLYFANKRREKRLIPVKKVTAAQPHN